ncbi:SDR family NAD(P)-dependent oxidoreductase, partial [Micrococcus luteus]
MEDAVAGPRSRGVDISLAGRTALVTGSTQGIGLAIATRLAQAGAEVAVNGRTAERVDAAIATITEAAPRRAASCGPRRRRRRPGHRRPRRRLACRRRPRQQPRDLLPHPGPGDRRRHLAAL